MDKATLLQLGADEEVERGIAYRDIEILPYVPSRADGPLLCRAGSVTVFIAPEGAEILDRVRSASQSQDEADADLANHLIDSFAGRQQVSRYRAWRMLRATPVFADLRYGGKTLAKHIFVPTDAEVVILENPYNGGRLAPETLTLVEHLRDDERQHLDAVALRHVPPMTPAEQAAIEQIPADQLEMNLDLNASCCDSITEYVERVVFVTFTVTCLCAGRDDPGELHLPDDQVAALGAARSARRLMDIRREALGHEHAEERAE